MKKAKTRKKRKTPALIPHSKIANALRRIWWFNSHQRKDAKARAKLGRGLGWLCEVCRTPTGAPEVDHVLAVGTVPGSKLSTEADDWNGYVARMFCPAEGLQVLCRRCHEAKTQNKVQEAS